MVTNQDVKNALTIIVNYEQQLRSSKVEVTAAWQVGCRVKLSEWGLEMQGKKNKNLSGTVIDVIEGAVKKTTDSTVCVKWDGVSNPRWMHVSQTDPLQNKINK